MRIGKNNIVSGFGWRAFCLVAICGWLVIYASPAAAQCRSCRCVNEQHQTTRQTIQDQHDNTRQFITDEFKKHQIWMLDTFFREHFVVALMLMTEQLVTNGYNQMLALGAIFDAKEQLESQRLFQRRLAEAHKKYQPGTEMCVFGTGIRSLAASNRNAEVDAFVFGRRSIDRQLGIGDVAAGAGRAPEALSRLKNVVELYCDNRDNRDVMRFLCAVETPPERRNKDIDYTRTMGTRMTLEIDLTDTDLTDDETDVFALASNLYAHHVFNRIPLPVMDTGAGQQTWQDARAVVAKRNVAENSFYAIMGMKAQGTESSEDTAQYLRAIFQRMDLSEDDARRLIGDRPSYFAQMQVLTQAMYQSPSFFINLYDKPANVARKKVSMQAINLMLDRDRFRSELRTEALLAQLLEMEVIKAQEGLATRSGLLHEAEAEAGGGGP